MSGCSEVGEVVHSLTLIEVVVVVIKSGLSKRCSRVGDGEHHRRELVAGHSLALAVLHHSVRAGRLNT